MEYKGKTYAVRSDWEFGQHLFSGTINGEEIFVQVERDNQTYRLFHGGSQADVSIVTPRVAELLKYMPVKVKPDMSRYLLSPMPGLLVSLAVKEGDERQGRRRTGGARSHENGKHPAMPNAMGW